MEKDSIIELFRIARDMAVAQHRHEVEMAERFNSYRALNGVREKYDDGGENLPKVDPRSIDEIFIATYRFMREELQTAVE